MSTEAKLQGNYIGTDATGSKALGSQNGVVASAGTNSIIGGTEPGARNLIAGHSNYGIYLPASGGTGSNGNKIQGNYIGTDATGTKALGNRFYGLLLSAGNGNMVGGTVAHFLVGEGPSAGDLPPYAFWMGGVVLALVGSVVLWIVSAATGALTRWTAGLLSAAAATPARAIIRSFIVYPRLKIYADG